MPRHITFGVILTGTGGPGEHNRRLDPEITGDASVDIDWYIEQAQVAEAAGLDLVFIVDVQFITPDPPSHGGARGRTFASGRRLDRAEVTSSFLRPSVQLATGTLAP